ncbi:conserved hypothetical protein [Thiomonas sp. X19]|nr:conserved hypothetical protein [Thiomonas sp. X19]
MPSQCLANHRERSISAPLSKKTRRTDQSDSLGFKSDSLLGIFVAACKAVALPLRHTVVTQGSLAAGAPWHSLYFLPEPQGQGSLRPTLAALRMGGALAWRQ